MEAYGLGSGNCFMQQKRCVSSMSHVTLQCQGVPVGPKWARRAKRPLCCSVGQGWNSGAPGAQMCLGPGLEGDKAFPARGMSR